MGPVLNSEGFITQPFKKYVDSGMFFKYINICIYWWYIWLFAFYLVQFRPVITTSITVVYVSQHIEMDQLGQMFDIRLFAIS